MLKEKIGIIVSEAKYPTNKLTTISAHVQVAVFTANILEKNNYDVTLITNKAPKEYRLPFIASKNLKVENILENILKKWPKKGIYWLKVALFIHQLWRIMPQFDILHFFGTNKTALLVGLIKIIRISKTILFITLHNFKLPRYFLLRLLIRKILRKIDCIITLTSYTKLQLVQCGLEENSIIVMRPGIQNRIVGKENATISKFKPFVLFWRNADWENGADICFGAFKQLNSKYPHINFVFAIRPGCYYDDELLKISRTHKNINVLFYPYPNNIRIVDLLTFAKIAVLPFRKLSINPQFAILETLATGTPLITSNIESNNEIVQNRKTSILIPPKIDEVVRAVKELLDNPYLAKDMSRVAKNTVQSEWNWKKYERRLINMYMRVK